MIDERDLLVAVLKDEKVDFLAKKLIEDIGSEYKTQQQIFEQKFYDWMVFARNYYSTTELKRAYSKLLEDHSALFTMIRTETYRKLAELDEYLDLDNQNVLFDSRPSWPVRNHQPNNKRKSLLKKPKKPKTLRQILNALKSRQELDMRKLRRKERKLKKKGVKLFDSYK